MTEQGCPSDGELLAFAEGLLDTAPRSGVEAHLAGCGDCSAVVGATYRETVPDQPIVIGRYEVLDEIGRGGMGQVLRARDPSLDRDVAIKLILPSALSPAARGRFAREAMALARLRHPSVVEVFDVGESNDAPYFVMEFVGGESLDAWSKGRSVQQILHCLIGAGEGLAAAHAAGILHRDFKPGNVLVGPDDRAKVGDFGLATFGPSQSAVTDGASTGTLTQTGALLGTLPYMAAELLDGGRASALSDQFAYCVTLFEVLFGRRPFHGRDVPSLSAAIRKGEVTPSDERVTLPPRVEAALTRGLSPTPQDRFPSMHDLLAELQPRRPVALKLAAGLGGVAAVTTIAVASMAQPSACRTFADGLGTVYDKGTRKRIREAFERSELPYVAVSVRSILAELDRYTKDWTDGARATCREAERGELPDQALDLRLHCLKHATQRLEAVLAQLQSPEQVHIERGGALVAALPDVRVCTDSEALAQFQVLPSNATQAKEADTLGAVLSEAFTKILVKDYDGTTDVLRRHASAFEEATYPPVRIRMLTLRGRVELARQHFAAAEQWSLQAHELAVEHRLDADACRTANYLGHIASRRGDSEQAQRWFDLALALAQSAGSNQLRAHVLTTSARFYAKRGELDRAVAVVRQAVELTDDGNYPPTSRAELLLAYSDHLLARGHEDDGRAELQQARELLLAMHGRTHPTVADVEYSLQIRASRRGDYEASLLHAREVLRIALAVNGERSLETVSAKGNLAIAQRELGQFEQAIRTLQEADALASDWPEHTIAVRVPILTNLGGVMLDMGNTAAAREALTHAKALVETDTPSRRALIDGILSRVELRDGNLRAARRLATAALTVSVETFGEDHFRTSDAATRLGRVELETGNFAAARRLLQRAVAVDDITPADRGVATFALARATFEDPEASDEARTQGLALARSAELALANTPSYSAPHDEVLAWLERHKLQHRERP